MIKYFNYISNTSFCINLIKYNFASILLSLLSVCFLHQCINSNTDTVELHDLVKLENLWTSIIGVVSDQSEGVKYNSDPTASLASELNQSILLQGQKLEPFFFSHDGPCCQSTSREIISAGFSDEGMYLNFVPFL